MSPTRRSVVAGTAAALAGCGAPISRSRGVGPTRRPLEGTARIGFVGDLMFARRVTDYHEDRPPASVWGSALDRLQALDGVVANLECVLTTRGESWPGKTWTFRADPEWVLPALGAAGVSAVSLANNHTMDYGAVSLRDTLEHLSSIDLAHAGAGHDLEAAIDPAVFEVDGVRVAIVGFTDRFGAFAAGADDPGTAYLDLDPDDSTTRRWVFEALGRVDAADPDIVVASLHWGRNYEPKTETHRTFARWLIDQGVDLVHGHSAHHVRGVEVYRGRPIIYDTGDFVNDYSPHEEYYNDRGLLAELVVDDGLESLRLVPVEVETEGVERASDGVRTWFRDRMRSLSASFGTTIRDARDGPGLTIPIGGS